MSPRGEISNQDSSIEDILDHHAASTYSSYAEEATLH